MHAIYNTLSPWDWSDRQGSDVPREVSEATNAFYLQHFVTPGMGRTAKEATNACYLQHFGSSVWYRIKETKNACYLQYFGPRMKYRRPRLYAIYNTLGPREVSEATIVCYLLHVGPPGKYRRQRLHAIYDTLGSQGGIGGHDCMLFTTRWVPREVSEATIVSYLRHFGAPGMQRIVASHKEGPRLRVIFIGVEPTRPAHS